ncbi:Gfo/Idh/MocA family protein [Haladaptatus caseinilyticus]|uniref:Gfo/Idh/MocA family protein n=1 Tax=Haladaptatus caseinilyticus TaxID=2993314 RepID=UPI00224B5172|nr:Gfo/Idh/MocA family oxidoreductase [Haladaptatus caseinilyticus]
MSIKLAAIGLGQLCMYELDTYNAMNNVEIIAGADISTECRDRFEERFDASSYDCYETMLEEHASQLDAVNIVTPHTLHYEQAMACLENDLHVFLEKPLVTDVEDAHNLVTSAQRRDRVLVVGYQRHYHPVYSKIKEIIDNEELGKIHTVSCYMGQNWIRKFPNAWRTDPDLSGGGQLYDSGSHLLDTLLWTTGTTPISVSAMMDYDDQSVDVNSSLSLQLKRNGRPVTASVTVTADGVEDPDTYEGLNIWGTKGRLTYGQDTLTITLRGKSPEKIMVEGKTDFQTLLTNKLKDFIEAVRGEHPPTVPGSFGQIVVALTEAAYEAHETKSVVDVRPYLDADPTPQS